MRAAAIAAALAVLMSTFVSAVTAPASAAEQTVALGDVGSGVAVQDSADGVGYLMYSSVDVHDRFSDDPPLQAAADQLIAVRFENGQWSYNPNGPWVDFTPVADDHLLAELDFEDAAANLLVGVSGTFEGIDFGYVSGDLVVTPDQWNGNPNNGEFGIAGTSVVIDDGEPVDPDDPDDPADPVDPDDPPPDNGGLNGQLDGDVNVALNRPASQAPGIVGLAGPQLAVDGNRDGDGDNGSVTRTFQGNDPYLQIDLESEVAISEVRVFGRTDCCRRASDNYFVFIADEAGIPGTSIADARNAPNVEEWYEGTDAQGGQTTVVNTTGRYVRIHIDRSNQELQLAEVEIILVDGATYVVDPGDQTTNADEAVNLALQYQASGGSLTITGLPGGLTATPEGLISGVPNNTGRWFVEANIVSADGTSHTAKFRWTVVSDAPVGENQEQYPSDPRLVSNRPVEGVDGVRGSNPFDSTPTLDVTVWDMQQLGDHMYVGGEFQTVHRHEDDPDVDGPGIDQPFLARFDITTGEWDETWRPVLDGNVHALERAPRGLLLVGGEFTSINGLPKTAGLAAIDPTTGAVDPSFEAFVERPFAPNDPAIVRELQVVGNQLYVVGNFSHINGAGGARVRVFKAARVSANYGTIDTVWSPEVAGGSVWGMGVDQELGRVHLVGFFTSVGAVAGTGINATVDTVTGALVPGLVDFAKNVNSRPEAYDIEYSGNMVWLAGSQHVLSLHDSTTRELVGWNYAGNACEQRFCHSPLGTGGDFQFVEKIGDFVYSGCHCNETTSDDGRVLNHYSGPLDLRSDHVTSMAYHATTGALVEEVRFDIGGNVDGGWSVGTDDRGCIWLGGDIENGGFVEPGGRVWARGFARFCNENAPNPPTNLAANVGVDNEILLSWDAPGDADVRGYLVYRNNELLGFSDVAAYIDDTALAGVLYTYEVLSENNLGVTSIPSAPAQAQIEAPPEPDTEAPSVPAGLSTGVDAAGVTLTWEASSDNVAVANYMIYRDGAFLEMTAGLTFVDATVEVGATYSYAVLAEDTSANRSELSAPVEITIDDDAPPPPEPEFGPPINLAGAEGPEPSVTLSWEPTDNTPLQSFLVYRDGSYYTWVPGDLNAFVDTDVEAGRVYSYQVRAVTVDGQRSARSAEILVGVGAVAGPDVVPPGDPANLVAVADAVGPEVTVTWDAAIDDRGIGSYLVYRDDSYMTWVDGFTTSFVDSTVVSGVGYEYQVRAVDTSGNRSARSAPVIVAVP